MGYETTYNGVIKLSSIDVEEKLSEHFIELGDEEEYFEIQDIEICDMSVRFGGYGKLYEDELEKFCLFIAKIDKGASGEVECYGEDSYDFWRIIIKNGDIFTEQGEIKYNPKTQKKFKSNKFNKDVYKITKDKSLLKEIIVEELKDGR